MDESDSENRQKLQAALEALEAEAERRREARGELEIITGVPRPPPCPADCTCWRHRKDTYDVSAEREKLAKYLQPKAPPPLPRPMQEPAPPALPREWRYIYTQLRAGNPDRNDPGQILEGQYGVAGNMVFVEDAKGELISKQKLEPGDDPASVARKLLREKWRGNSTVAGFYDGPINRPNITIH